MKVHINFSSGIYNSFLLRHISFFNKIRETRIVWFEIIMFTKNCVPNFIKSFTLL